MVSRETTAASIPVKVAVDVFERYRNDERGPVFRRERQGVAAKLDHLQLLRLQAGNEGALQCSRHERILLSAEISLRGACAFSGFPHRRQVKKRTAIAGDKFLQQAGDFGFRRGIFDVVDEARERQNLPLAEQLLRQVSFE